MKLSDYIIEKENDLRKCPICGLWKHKLGLASHFHSNHNPKYTNVGSTAFPKWCEGKTKETDIRIAKLAQTISKRTKGKKKNSLLEEHKRNISRGMIVAHENGIAHNIGKSRWNNEPSYPEKFFMEVIKNEFVDKNYIKEFPLGKYALDFAWPNKKLCIEIDGEQHQRFEEIKERDKRKNSAIEKAGWKILRIKWKDMFHDTKTWIQIAKKFIDRADTG